MAATVAKNGRAAGRAGGDRKVAARSRFTSTRTRATAGAGANKSACRCYLLSARARTVASVGADESACRCQQERAPAQILSLSEVPAPAIFAMAGKPPGLTHLDLKAVRRRVLPNPSREIRRAAAKGQPSDAQTRAPTDSEGAPVFFEGAGEGPAPSSEPRQPETGAPTGAKK